MSSKAFNRTQGPMPMSLAERKYGRLVEVIVDVETTGLDYRRNSIHQIGVIIRVAGVEQERLDIRLRPHPKAIIEQKALEASHVTEEEIKNYPPYEEGYKKFMNTVYKYIDRYDKYHKAYLVGFNIAKFDIGFLTKLSELCEDKYFFGAFWPETVDVMVLAGMGLRDVRLTMPNFRLGTVYKTVTGTDPEEDKLHDASYDCELTMSILDTLLSHNRVYQAKCNNIIPDHVLNNNR